MSQFVCHRRTHKRNLATADAPATRLQMSEFTTKNAAARHRPADDGSQLDVRDMRRLVQALPQYRRASLLALQTLLVGGS